MWKKYELGLRKSTMTMWSKLIVMFIIIQWIGVLFFIAITGFTDVTIIQISNVFIYITAIMLIANMTKNIYFIEAWLYIKNFIYNRPQVVNYWVASIEDEDDKTKWIIRY